MNDAARLLGWGLVALAVSLVAIELPILGEAGFLLVVVVAILAAGTGAAVLRADSVPPGAGALLSISTVVAALVHLLSRAGADDLGGRALGILLVDIFTIGVSAKVISRFRGMRAPRPNYERRSDAASHRTLPEASEGRKRCPDCAEEVHEAARVCRHCGYDFEVGRQRAAGGARTSGYAIASLILGLLWIGGIGAILAVIFGHIAKRDIRASRGAVGGSGTATAGLILGYLGLVAIVIWGFILASA